MWIIPWDPFLIKKNSWKWSLWVYGTHEQYTNALFTEKSKHAAEWKNKIKVKKSKRRSTDADPNGYIITICSSNFKNMYIYMD